MKYMSVAMTSEFFKVNEIWYENSMAKGWLKSEKRGKSQLSAKLKRMHFKGEIVDAIAILYHIVGNAQIESFEDWMCQFILDVCDENVFIDWAKIICFHLNEQLVNFQKTTTFHLCSCLTYIIASQRSFWLGLKP